MPQKSNKANIIITAVAIIIILGGVFILNEAISSSNRNDEETTVRASRQNPEPEPIEIVQEEPEPEENNFTTGRDSEESQNTTTNQENTGLRDDNASDNGNTDESVDRDRIDRAGAELEEGQIALKVVSIGTTDSQGLTAYQFEVVDSTFEDSKFFRTGATINRVQLAGFTGVREGGVYRVAISFTETGSGFRINSIRNLGDI